MAGDGEGLIRSANSAFVPALIALLSPLTSRLLLMLDLEIDPQLGDLRGLMADLAISGLVAASIVGLIRLWKWGRHAALLFVGVWSLANFANAEHIRELGSMTSFANIGFLFDPTFFRGSALASAWPLMLVVTTSGAVFALWLWSKDDRSADLRWPLVGAVLLLVIAEIWPADPGIGMWRQSNFVLQQASNIIQRRASIASEFSLPRIVAADLDGVPIVDPLPETSNVLLVILEGVSGAYLPTVSAHHGVSSPIRMPELDAIASRGLSWSTFVVHQRQTNRGEYAVLCGDYPKLLTSEPKMTELAGAGRLDCLPTFLGARGFATVYLQAAPMAFMVKDQFMPAAGFERALGDTWFKHAFHRNQWGVDDRAFFEQAVGMVEELERGHQPWFLTLLTVGTHHPFNTPADFEGSYEPGTAGWAMEYLDRAIGAFVHRLDNIGVLDDTLVIIVNDESRELVAGDNDIANSLRQAWGVLIALHPSGASRLVHEPAMQLDLPISILDALGWADRSGYFGGRSIFREYRDPRQLLWANTYLGLVGGLSEHGQLAVCTENFSSCAAADLPGSLFSPDLQFSPIGSGEVQWLIRGAQASLGNPVEDRSSRELLLASPGPIPVVPDITEQFLFGGQFLTIPAGVRAIVEIEASVNGRQGGLGFHHDLIVERRQAYLRSGRLNVGNTLKISYSVAARFPLENVESRFWIDTVEGRDLEIDFSVSRIRLEPLARGAADSGVVEQLFVIDYPSSDRQ